MNTLELLNKIDYCQGGTIHQYTREYNTTADKLISISKDKLDFINTMFTTGKHANDFIEVARKYYKTQGVSIQDICKMLIKKETIS